MGVVVGFNWPVFHDNAAAAIVDGKLAFATEEERHSRNKHSSGEFPYKAIASTLNYLSSTGINPRDVDAFAVNFDPALFSRHRNLSWRRLVSTSAGMSGIWLPKLLLSRVYRSMGFSLPDNLKIHTVGHHLAHAASAHYFSGFDSSLTVVCDGYGEIDATTAWRVKGGEFEKILGIDCFSSLGLLYEFVSHELGFGRLEGPGKVMGLAAYGGKDVKICKRLSEILKVADDMESLPYEFAEGDARGFFVKDVFSRYRALAKRAVGNVTWDPSGKLQKRASDVAWALQKVTEDALLSIARFGKKQTGNANIALAGGVALNSKANMELHYSGMFNDIFVFPAANDAGSVAGAAAYTYDHALGGRMKRERLNDAYLGMQYGDDLVKRTVKESGFRSRYVGDDTQDVAALISKGKVVSWYDGRAEFGPRALGNRSIFADPRRRGMLQKLNEIKGREWWRPLAPTMLENRARDYLVDPKRSRFMTVMYKVNERATKVIPAVCHVDDTTRPEIINSKVNRRVYRLLKEFEDITGEGIVVNTSFNIKEPLVETPDEALRSFSNGGFSAMYLQGWLVEKR
jgi:carbamoyltransferase